MLLLLKNKQNKIREGYMNAYYDRKYSHFFVQAKPNKYDCPICGRKGIYKDKYRHELCLKCEMEMRNKGYKM